MSVVLIVVGSAGAEGCGVTCGVVVATGGVGAGGGMACGALEDPPPHALMVTSNPAAVTRRARGMDIFEAPVVADIVVFAQASGRYQARCTYTAVCIQTAV